MINRPEKEKIILLSDHIKRHFMWQVSVLIIDSLLLVILAVFLFFLCEIFVFLNFSRPYAHILSVPVSETAYPGQTQYQTLQQSQPYAVYPQATQTYGLPPFGKASCCKQFLRMLILSHRNFHLSPKSKHGWSGSWEKASCSWQPLLVSGVIEVGCAFPQCIWCM